jgi:ribonucleoside-diphosphate reductase alpha chain
LSIKKSKKGPLKQVVPQYQTLKNNYTLLWDMPNNEGYINIVAAMQKFFDQAISGNWSYNPKHFENNEVPLSVMMKDMLTTYKMGWKTSYYQNTYDFKGEEDHIQPEGLEDTKIDTHANGVTMNGAVNGHANGHVNGVSEPITVDTEIDGEECEACNI